MLEKAIKFASEAHRGHLRKVSGKPYIVHPMETCVIVSNMTTDTELLAAALLHATIEDTPVTYEQLEAEFGKRVADFVQSESEDKSKTWMERKQHTIDHIREKTLEEKILILGDKLSNIRSLNREYVKNGDAVWEYFKMKDKKKQGWYYKGVAEALTDLSAYPEYQEFVLLCEKVFG